MKSFLQWQQPIDQTRHEPWPVYLGQWVVDALLLHQSNNLEIYYVFIIDCKMSVECLLCRCCAFLPRCMECRRGRWEFCPSVRPSVCLSNAWFVTKRKKDLLRFSLPYERSFSLVFWEEEWLVEWWGQPCLPEILGQPIPVVAKSPILNRYSLVAPQP